MVKSALALLLTCLHFLSLQASTDTTDVAINDFSLIDTKGNIVSTKDYPNAKGLIIIFTCNHCPFAKLYTDRLNALNQKYSNTNVPLLAINSMDTLLYEDEGLPYMQARAIKDKFNFPYLQDVSQAVGQMFGALHTPMAYILWKVDGKWLIKYKGAIDDNGEKEEWATPYISNAIGELLTGKEVTTPKTHTLGCRIFYRKK